VNNGVVTLSGSIFSFPAKYAVERVVQAVSGVKAVANTLAVPLPWGRGLTDTDIAQAVVKALEQQASLPHHHIQVSVRDAWVFLEGSVDWPSHKAAVEQAVTPVVGVKGVHNSLIVREKATPSEIHARIAEAFCRRAELEAGHITVAMAGGTVILRGHARSWLDREIAAAEARATPGVIDVHNHITVKT
jgi:osmotically-inducible protein OsmY